MAIINCPECNKEVSDKAVSCPNCGFGVMEYIEKQRRMDEIEKEAAREAYWYTKDKMKAEKNKIEQKEKEELNRKDSIYYQAINKFNSQNSKDIEEAEQLFEMVIGWKEAESYLRKCQSKIIEVKKYEESLKEKNKKQKKIAIIISIIFMTILATVLIIYFKEIIPRQNYEKGMAAFNNREYIVAYQYFSKSNLETNEIESIILEAAESKVMSGEYEDINMLFMGLSDISKNKFCEERYQQAETLFKENSYEEAYELYMFLQYVDYGDIEEKAAEAHTYFGTGVCKEYVSLNVHKSYDTVETYDPTRKETEVVDAVIEVPYKEGVKDYSLVTITFKGSNWRGSAVGWGNWNYKYVGTFLDGNITGEGILYTSYGIENGEEDVLYKGEFLNGAYNGQGTLYDNGKKYIEGTWKNNNIEGSYTKYYSDGSVNYSGTVNDGIDISAKWGTQDFR